MYFKVYANTDPGCVRPNNEDAWLAYQPREKELFEKKGAIFIVADGMGGYEAGEIASSIAVSTIKEAYYIAGGPILQALLHAFFVAHKNILKASKGKKMGSTATAITLTENRVNIVHIGDTRAYLFRNGKLEQITIDHSKVGELLSSGKITREEAATHPERHILTQALGAVDNINPFFETMEVFIDDKFLLCSDGLHGVIQDTTIEKILMENDILKAGSILIDLARAKGGPDNITVILVHYIGDKVKTTKLNDTLII